MTSLHIPVNMFESSQLSFTQDQLAIRTLKNPTIKNYFINAKFLIF